jgi:hypothetical protein
MLEFLQTQNIKVNNQSSSYLLELNDSASLILMNVASGCSSTVSGGSNNTASVRCSTIGGGYGNTASGRCATVSGGASNTASGYRSTVSGGYCNTASGCASAILGGNSNSTNGCSCVMIVGSNITANRSCTTFVNNLSISIADLPTSDSGLPSGSVWRCTADNTLRIKP